MTEVTPEPATEPTPPAGPEFPPIGSLVRYVVHDPYCSPPADVELLILVAETETRVSKDGAGNTVTEPRVRGAVLGRSDQLADLPLADLV